MVYENDVEEGEQKPTQRTIKYHSFNTISFGDLLLEWYFSSISLKWNEIDVCHTQKKEKKTNCFSCIISCEILKG